MRMVLRLERGDGETLVTVEKIPNTEDTGEHRVERMRTALAVNYFDNSIDSRRQNQSQKQRTGASALHGLFEDAVV